MNYYSTKDEGKVVVSFDALFGLPRKKTAGTSFRPPLHGSLMFGEQSSVDEFVATGSKKMTKVKIYASRSFKCYEDIHGSVWPLYPYR